MNEYNCRQIFEIIEKDDYTIENATVIDPLFYKGSNLKKLNFDNVIFLEPVEFKNISIKEIVFTNCQFRNKVVFSDSAFSDIVNFEDTIFQSEVFFLRTVFGSEKSASLQQIWFSRAHFFKNVHFNRAIFNLHADFNESLFNKMVDFSESNFKKDAMFIETIFMDRAIFWEAVFNGKAFFLKTEFRNSANFNLVSFLGQTSFADTHLERIDFRTKFVKNLNLNHTTIKNSHMTRENVENEIEQEKKEDYAEAREIYIMLKNNFNSIGRYEDQSWAFLKEKEMERKNYLKSKNYREYIMDIMVYYLYGYGEKPLYTIRASIFITFMFSLIYWYSGSIIPNMNNPIYMNSYNLTFWDSIYFSVVTFTTLGYGDWYPDPGHWVRYVVMMEAFVGVFMIGLFVFSITRRTANR